MLVLHDAEHHNTATIQLIKTRPYYGAPRKTDGYRLSLMDDEDEEVFFVSVYESLKAAVDALESMNFIEEE